ncbi:transcriptional regulator [Streptomyces spectabilis]|uniref:transcriptional regulator n=1 Tax=Streptomyces spectabilis TaxID=68270 RepID=UPI001CEF644B|nr:transcriptional regulator [Streptomyces spectabilis]
MKAPAPPTVQTALPTRSSTLLRLAAEGATGALLRDTGTLYLTHGMVSHAESASAPGVDVLLVAGGRLPRAVWDEAAGRAGPRRQVGGHLVAEGHLTPGELEICLLTALYDAALFALAPGGGPTRFRRGVGHGIGTVRPVPADAVEREARRRRRLLDSAWPGPAIDTAPLVRRRVPPGGGASVPPRQRALLDLADGRRTPADLSRLLGRPVFHVLLEVRRLAVAGLIDPPRPPPPGPDVPDVPPRDSPVARPGAADGFTSPDAALLRRVRDALEAL